MTFVEVRDRQQWRAWLARNHESSPGVWLVFHKSHTGAPTISYEDSVCEALCFGWVDSLIKRLDEDRYARKFTPRKAGSRWSTLNRQRWARMKEAGLLTQAGLAAEPTDRDGDTPKLDVPALTGDLAVRLKKVARAWTAFQKLPPSQQRLYLLWIYSAKRPETRDKRIGEAIVKLLAGEKIGLK